MGFRADVTIKGLWVATMNCVFGRHGISLEATHAACSDVDGFPVRLLLPQISLALSIHEDLPGNSNKCTDPTRSSIQ